MKVLWVITKDCVGTGFADLRSRDCQTQGDVKKCTVKFQLQDWDGNLRYEGKIDPEVLDEDIEFDFPHNCYVFLANDGGWPSLKARNKEKRVFIEQQEFRKERRWAKKKATNK